MLLSRQGMLARIPQILAEYERIILNAKGLRKVAVESAATHPMGLKPKLRRVLGRKLVISEKTDSSLLAGVRMFVDDDIFIDASGKRFLREMFPRAV